LFDYKITVFTAVYNRAHTLDRLYQSLKRQTFRDFEWVVVDDGSIDNTEQLINSYISSKDFFSITYYKQKHGGKHRAINNGLDLAKGELFFLVDSDDYITDNALERIIFWEDKIHNKKEYAGLCGLSGYDIKEYIGATFNGEFLDITLIEQYKKGISGDHANILYTDLFKKYKYPEFEGEWHIAPGVPFVRMAKDGYKLRYFNEIIYIAEYLEDGLTKMGDKKILENFKGYTLRTKEWLDINIPLKRKIEIIGKYTYLGKKMKLKYSEISKKINVNIVVVYCLGLVARLFYTLR